MEVENTTFMVEKMGAECAPLQFVRELTQNAIDAVDEHGNGRTGTSDGMSRAIIFNSQAPTNSPSLTQASA
jgi:hypothetical protein